MLCKEASGAEQVNEQVYFCSSFNDHKIKDKRWLMIPQDRACVVSLSRSVRLDRSGDLRCRCVARPARPFRPLQPLAALLHRRAQSPGGGCTSRLLPGPVGVEPPWQDPAATRGAGSPVAAAGMHAPSSRKGQGLLPITPQSLPVPARHRGREDKEGRFSPWRGNRS